MHVGKQNSMQMRFPAEWGRHNGFTLIELLVVLAIVALLLTLAVPRYYQSLDQSKEAILLENLQTVRRTIDRFYGDTGRYPASLEELVEKHYLRELPYDPVLDSSVDWRLIAPPEGRSTGIYDIKSQAAGVNRDGKPLSEL